MLKYTYTIILLSFVLLLNSCGCGEKNDKKPKNEKSAVEQTKISYTINLDDSKKIKEENNKLYYKVPVNTEVIITATVSGPEKTKVSWNQKFSGGSMNGLPNSGGLTWKHAANNKITITVSGVPSVTKQINGVDLFVNEPKEFIITWE